MIISTLEKALHYYYNNHKLISNNISNATTPLFEAQSSQDFIKYMTNSTALHMDLAVTNPRHISGKEQSNIRALKRRQGTEMKLNGNNVSLPFEMKEMSMNEINYKSALEAYNQIHELYSSFARKIS